MLLVGCVALIACGPQARGSHASNEAVPPVTAAIALPAAVPTQTASVADEPDGKAVSIELGDGRSIAVSGFRVVSSVGLSRARCGVTIAGKRVITMGEGDTEVYSCEGLAAMGGVPPAGTVQRVGLIYDVGSRNASFRTAVVLREDAGDWRVDPQFAGRFEDVPAGRSLATLRKALR